VSKRLRAQRLACLFISLCGVSGLIIYYSSLVIMSLNNKSQR
jgi:hypothetical protein